MCFFLFCFQGSGTLRVYDFEAQCFESDLKFTEPRKGNTVRLSRLLLVDKHVWVGSMSRAVHILDVETLCRENSLRALNHLASIFSFVLSRLFSLLPFFSL